MSSEKAIIRVLGEAAVSGRFISVDFVKMNGELRTLVCKVDSRALDRLDKDIVTVFDVRKGGYRSFKINSVIYLSHDGRLTAAF
jgi:hypothetical protein